jgi:hypothetical protein
MANQSGYAGQAIRQELFPVGVKLVARKDLEE